VAYSAPADNTQVRNQAALVSMLWTEHSHNDLHNLRYSRTVQATGTKPEALQTLLIEYGAFNIVAQRVDNDLILVLISDKIPGRLGRDLNVDVEKGASDAGDVSDRESSRPIVVQKQKAKTLARYIAKQTEGMNASNDDDR